MQQGLLLSHRDEPELGVWCYACSRASNGFTLQSGVEPASL